VDPDPKPDPHVIGPSGSISQRYGSRSVSGSFPFLKKVLSGLKYCLQNKILTQNFSKILNFKIEDNVPAGTVSYKKKIWKNNLFCILKVTE
jgi:hypothetical protein